MIRIIFTVAVLTVSFAQAQSSSLFVQPPPEPAPAPERAEGPPNRLARAIAPVSYSAVRLPDPHKFAVNDLITIVVRESTETDAASTLDTHKENNIDGSITSFPNLQLQQLFQGRLGGNKLTNGPAVGLKFKNEFKGDGQYDRKDTFTSRITGRIIDVKPNGTLVIEARKFIQSDEESMEMILTGTCRKEDIAVDNTIPSTAIYDLRLTKNHTGELRNATHKGILTKAFEWLFNF